MIFGDFWAPSGLPFGDHWYELWGEKAHFLQKGSLEGPREGFGAHFRWILEVFLSIFDLIFDVFWVKLWHYFLYGICMECV